MNAVFVTNSSVEESPSDPKYPFRFYTTGSNSSRVYG